MKEIIIVGSGRSLLGNNLGVKIDSFKNIVRFNPADRFIDNGQYINDTGSRMTVFSFNVNQITLRRVAGKLTTGALLKKHREVSQMLCTYGVRKKVHPYIRSTRVGRKILEYLHRTKMDCPFLGHRNTMSRVKQLVGPPYLPPRRRGRHSPYMSFTAGFQTVCYCLEKYDRVFLCGFDYLSENSSRDHFYGGKGKVSNRSHCLKAEANLINRLIQKTNKIELLK